MNRRSFTYDHVAAQDFTRSGLERLSASHSHDEVREPIMNESIMRA